MKRVHAASVHASAQLSLFKTMKVFFKLPIQKFAAVSAFSLISGIIALQYDLSSRILLECDGDSESVVPVDTDEALFSAAHAANEFNEEDARRPIDSSLQLRWRLLALFAKADPADVAQYCTLEVTAVSLIFTLYAVEGVSANVIGDISSAIDHILNWTFLRHALFMTAVNCNAPVSTIEPETDFFTMSMTALGADGVSCGEVASHNEARSDATIPTGSDEVTAAALQLDEVQVSSEVSLFPLYSFNVLHQLQRLVDGSDVGAA
jgi:hypothetical protein